MAGRGVMGVIFDMDGLMIDSEPLWHIAEQQTFARAGITLSEDDCNDTTGLRIDEVVAFHAERKPWGDTPTRKEVAEQVRASSEVPHCAALRLGVPDDEPFLPTRCSCCCCCCTSVQIVATMVELVKTQGKPMAGLEEALAFFEVSRAPGCAVVSLSLASLTQEAAKKSRPEGGWPCVHARAQSHKLPLAVASSSHMVLLNAALEGLGLVGRFSHVVSAEFEPYGKPHPGVYISAAAKLGVPPDRCLALEDSVNGTLAAKAAKMVCISVPEAHNLADPRFAIADVKLTSLAEVPAAMTELWGRGDGAGPVAAAEPQHTQ
jgi:beta-phosphoglucomutase-like phosphatase (HAD superfamily)